MINSISNFKQLFQAHSNYLFFFLITCTLLLCAWQTFTLLTCGKIAAIKEEREELRNRMEYLIEITSRETALETEWVYHQEKLANTSYRVPFTSEVAFALADLEEMLKDYPIILRTFKADEITRLEEYGIVKITVHVTGSDVSLHRMLKAMEEEYPYLLKLKELAWSTIDSREVNLELELCLIVAADSTAAQTEEAFFGGA